MSIIRNLLYIIIFAFFQQATGQIGIGTTSPDLSSILEVSSTERGFLMPRMTTTQRNGINQPAKGLLLYNTSEDCLQINTGTPVSPDWNCIGSDVSPVNCSINGFEGNYIEGFVLNSTHKFSITLTNTTFSTGNFTFSTGDVTLSGVTGISVVSANPSSATLQPGETISIWYGLSGTPTALGELVGDWALFGQSCSESVSVTNLPPLPANITLTAGLVEFITSIDDSNYAPFTTPVTSADTSSSDPDGVIESPHIDFQGILDTNGIAFEIGYTVTGGTVNLPAFSQITTVPSYLIENGTSAREVELSYEAASLSVGTGTITAKIKTVTADTLNALKLDINEGIGNDFLGILMAEFIIATDNVGGSGTVHLRDIAAVRDRNFGDGDHDMLYLPVLAEDGNYWFNNNLGAAYSNTNNVNFNVTQQAVNAEDAFANGSLFQWGRKADGHELMNMPDMDRSNITAVNGTTTVLADEPVHTDFIDLGFTGGDWRITPDDNLWNGVNAVNNPCPKGFRVPSSSEFSNLITITGITDTTNMHASSDLRLTKAIARIFFGIPNPFQAGLFSTSTPSGIGMDRVVINNTSALIQTDQHRFEGLVVRCIKD